MRDGVANPRVSILNGEVLCEFLRGSEVDQVAECGFASSLGNEDLYPYCATLRGPRGEPDTVVRRRVFDLGVDKDLNIQIRR